MLIGVGVAFTLPPLLRGQNMPGVGDPRRKITVKGNPSTEFERMFGDGDLDKVAYDEACRKLESELLDELKSDSKPAEHSSETQTMAAIIAAVTLPGVVVGLYFLSGSPRALIGNAEPAAGWGASVTTAGESSPGQIPHPVEDMVERLQNNAEDRDAQWMPGRF